MDERSSLHLPYASRRYPAVAARGMVATSHPEAVRAGLAMLEGGGNAIDAAIAMAAMLVVVDPTSNGIGGDAFALVWDGTTLHGYNGSGRSPTAMTLDHVRQAGHETMPTRGWLPVTVPGAPRAWHDLHARFGRLTFEQVLAPAIETARRGHAVTPVVAYWWKRSAEIYTTFAGPEFAGWAPAFAPEGQGPAVGDLWRCDDQARTLQRISESRSDDFYRGELARRIVSFADQTGGLLTAEDLAAHVGEWVAPIHGSYRDHEVWEIPPNGQGIAALLALGVLREFGLASLARESVEAYHLQIEAMKLAFADAHRYVADPSHVEVPVERLLSQDYARSRAALIGERAGTFGPGEPPRGGTVYLCAADADGLMVSYIQSNYQGFGSGIVVPGTGVALQNRGVGFSLEPGHPNVLAPRKRPFHTIIPSFLTRGGVPIGPFGVMGGPMQPQGHVQMVLNTIDWSLNPQASLDAPRWHVTRDATVLLEAGIAPEIVAGLRDRGHAVRVEPSELGSFGRGQIIWRMANGSYIAGSDSRADGLALGY